VSICCVLQAIGSSAAESSTISSFDASLGITHDKGEATPSAITFLYSGAQFTWVDNQYKRPWTLRNSKFHVAHTESLLINLGLYIDLYWHYCSITTSHGCSCIVTFLKTRSIVLH